MCPSETCIGGGGSLQDRMARDSWTCPIYGGLPSIVNVASHDALQIYHPVTAANRGLYFHSAGGSLADDQVSGS
jgi:hypothetical protein